MRVSFCTNCRQRRQDLECTLRANLDHLHVGEELVLLDYNCPEGTRDWVIDQFAGSLSVGQLRLFSERSSERFFMSHAKNVCHLLGRGDVLVNLDADNFLDDKYLSLIRSNDFAAVPFLFPRAGTGGFKGRTAMRRDVFIEMGGYDEQMRYGYGYEEIDLFRRFKKIKRYASRDVGVDPACVIETTQAQKLAGQLVRGTDLAYSARIHRQMCEENLTKQKFVANASVPWGVATLVDHLNNEVLISSEGVSPSFARAG